MYAKDKSKKTEENKEAYFDGTDHWLTAEEARRLGFIENIYDAEPIPEESTPEQIYNTFNNRLAFQSQSKSKMNLDELRKRPAFSACTSEEDVMRQISTLEAEAAKVPGLRAKVTVFENKEKEARIEAIKTCLDVAEADGRINQQTRTTYQAL